MSNNSLNVWDGILRVGESKEAGVYDVSWDGTLIVNAEAPDSSTVEPPQRNAFLEKVSSDNQFVVSGTVSAPDKDMFKSYTLTLTAGEGWDMDGTKNKDEEHEVLLHSLLWRGSPDKRQSLAFAKGKDAHGGVFVSTGWVRPGNRITLARRYVADDRAKWDLETLREKVLEQIYNEEQQTIIMPPWKCEIFNAQTSQ